MASELTLEQWIAIGVAALILFAIFYILSIWIYQRPPANMAFIRTGFWGAKVCVGRGAMVFPVFQQVSWVSLETIKLIIARTRDQAVLTRDNIRVDISAELYAHVGESKQMILRASRTLGEKTFDPEKVRNLLEAKVVSAMRSAAATKTLAELHGSRDLLSQELKEMVQKSFQQNGLELEEVTIVALEQTPKEFFRTDNVFDIEGLKVVTAITSTAKREVHNTEKKTQVAIRQRELEAQLELLQLEKQEAFAKAAQEKDISNEQAQRLSENQVFILQQRKSVEAQEIEIGRALESMQIIKEIQLIEERKKREHAESAEVLARQANDSAKKVAQIAHAEAEKLAALRREQAEQEADKERVVHKLTQDREKELAEIKRQIEISAAKESARMEETRVRQEAELAIRQKLLETQLGVLELEKDEAIAIAAQERDIAQEQARVVSEKQKYLLELRTAVEQDELKKALDLEKAQITKDISLLGELEKRHKAEIHNELTRVQEERDRDIAVVKKSQLLEQAEIERFKIMAQREKAEQGVSAARSLAEAERQKDVALVQAETAAGARKIEEVSRAETSRIQAVTEAEAHKASSALNAEATIIRAQADGQAKILTAAGLERELAAKGKAEAEVEGLRNQNIQRRLEAEAKGLSAKAEALKSYDQGASFLELAKMRIDAEKEVLIDQARAMGNALHGAEIRMTGSDSQTLGSVKNLFQAGYSIGEVLDGISESMPKAFREKLASNGLRGIFGKPYSNGNINSESIAVLGELVNSVLKTKAQRSVNFSEALGMIEEKAAQDQKFSEVVDMLKDSTKHGMFNEMPFDKVWNLVQAVAKTVR
ncbi:MAG: SPFH domain-containing protein [Deltaproteobacteria bacterium]|nr:SPFH domain-containing protein [Deltaproteobacteria bacterium]